MLTTLSALLLLAAADIDPEPPAPGPLVRFRGVSASNGASTLTFEVTNNGPKPIAYLGYGNAPNKNGERISPLYAIQELKAKAWKNVVVGWCGTGVGNVSVPARGKVTFTVSVPAGDWDEVRVGLDWYPSGDKRGEGRTTWSDPVTRKA